MAHRHTAFCPRLRTTLGREPFRGGIELNWSRARANFYSVPTIVGLAVLRVVGNAWPTTRRIGGMPCGCALGCTAVGGDDIRHQLCCPTFRATILATRAIAPPSVVADKLELALFVHPLSCVDALRTSVWMYAVSSMVRAARATITALTAARSSRTLCAQRFALWARAPLAHRQGPRCAMNGGLSDGQDKWLLK